MSEKNLIGINNICNNRCLMCTNPDRPWVTWDGDFDYSYAGIVKRLGKYKKDIDKCDSLYLTGGEPTIHPRFLDILEQVKKNFPKKDFGIFTNGRMFAYEDFAKKTLKAHPDIEIDISLCGPNEKIHDKITQVKGSFEQAKKGIKNLFKYKENSQKIHIRFVVTKLTYKYADQTLKMIEKEFPEIDQVIIIFWEVEGQAIKNIKKVGINYKKVKPYIEKTYPLLKNFKEVRFYHFPLCTISEKFWPYVWRTLPKNETKFIQACQKCKVKDYCLGIPEGYLENMGDNGFEAIRKDVKIKKSEDWYKPIKKLLDDK